MSDLLRLESSYKLYALNEILFEDILSDSSSFFKAPSQIQEYERTTLKNADISFMYSILRNSVVPKPKNGWGNYPQDNNIELADDIERIRHYRNIICHTDASRMETTKFNESVLDLVGVMWITQRLHKIYV